ncbi:MAG: nuclear transport factor 2 family protein [Betaproteobacteria bacterium]|nr:nuclear transport factor 2 family protein [Betaproteobacteria bacterium]
MSPETRSFESLLATMTRAICAGDGAAAAACFTPGGMYHDGFYGEFAGREAIARMVTDCFHRDARDFAWTLHDALSDGRIGFARYDFRYVSRIAGSEGCAAGFSGIAFCALEGGLIRRYAEQFERAPVLAQLGFSDARIVKSVRRWAKA